MIRTLILLTLLGSTLCGEETARQTTQARLWLQVPAGQPPLRDIQVSSGSATPAPWEKDPAVRERHTDVIFPVRWWDWSALTLSFTPPADGTVVLSLTGPWEEDKPGTTFRMEVLWDEITAEGTQIENGSFESRSDGQPDAWKSVYANPLPATSWPLAGAQPLQGDFLAASCQSRPLAQTLTLTAGQKVTIKLHAKAATLPGKWGQKWGQASFDNIDVFPQGLTRMALT